MNNELEDTRKQALYIANNLTDLVMAYRIANDDYRAENQQLRAKAESLSEAEVNLIAENQQLQTKIESLESTVQKLRDDCELLNQEVSQKDKYVELNLSLMNTLQEKKDLIADQDDLIRKLNDDIASFEKTDNTLSENFKDLDEKNTKLFTKYCQLETENIKAKQLIQELKDKILALEYQAEIDKDEIKSLREYIEKFQKPANLDVISLLNDYVDENIYSDWATNLTMDLIQDYKQLLKKYNLFLSVNLAGKDITIR